MKKLLVLSLVFLPYLALSTPAPGTANYVLVNAKDIHQIKPLATIHDGVFDGLSLENSAPNPVQASEVTDHSAVGLNGITVYAYLDGRLVGTTEIFGYDIGQQDEWNDDVQLLPPKDASGESAQVFTTQPLPNAQRATRRKPSATEVAAARALIRGVLHRHRVPVSEWNSVLGTMEIRPINVSAGQPEILLMTWGSEIGEKALGFFLIGERVGKQFHLTGGNFHWGGLVCGQTSWTFLGNADLDGDGIDELLYEAWGWESVGYWMLKRQNGRWKPAGANGQETDVESC